MPKREIAVGEPIIPALQRAIHAVAAHLDGALSDLRLNQAEAHVLAYLAAHDGCTVGDLRRDFGHRHSTLTSILDRMEARGFLRRAVNPRDRRSLLVLLTPPGRDAAQAVQAALATLHRAIDQRTDPRQRRGFAAVLAAIEEAIR